MGFSFVWGRDSMNWGWFSGMVRPGITVYDIGANRGQMTLLFARLVGPTGTVVSFEPVPTLFADLIRNCELNGVGNVRPYNVAASDIGGRSGFRYSEALSTQGKLSDVEPEYHSVAEEVIVRTCRIDDLAGELPAPSILKIDVEGAAAKVLAGARQTIERHRPGIYIELHGPEERQAVKVLMRDHGYTAKELSGVDVPDPTDGWHSPLWCVPA